MITGIEAGRSKMNKSNEAKLQQFRAVTVAHPHLLAARERLMAILSDAPRNSVIFVLGPTGVGKSTLRARVKSDLTNASAVQLENDFALLPVVSIEAEAPDTGIFSWRDHFKRQLDAMREPLINYKLDRKGKPWGLGRPPFPFDCGPRSSGAEYQYSVEQAVRFRRPVAVLIDEAQHLTKVGSGRRLVDQLDVIKSMANHTFTPHVMIGTYDLLAFRNLSGQLSRRSLDVHFSRYRVDRPGEAAIFMNVVRSFASHLPVNDPDEFAVDWEFLYERSVGCIGILKDWLAQALSVMLRRGASQLERRDLEACALSVNQCEKILSECVEGEMLLEESDESRRRLRARLGLDATQIAKARQSRSTVPTTHAQRARVNRRPGQRIAKRDPIGIGAEIYGV
jgi:energy-coupling factor transporter ATP-binding protein EcfA2